MVVWGKEGSERVIDPLSSSSCHWDHSLTFPSETKRKKHQLCSVTQLDWEFEENREHNILTISIPDTQQNKSVEIYGNAYPTNIPQLYKICNVYISLGSQDIIREDSQ